MIFYNIMICHAQTDDFKFLNSNGNYVEINIQSTLKNQISNEDIKDIINSNKDINSLTIEKIQYINTDIKYKKYVFPFGLLNTKNIYDKKYYSYQDSFVESLAKGESKYIDYSVKFDTTNSKMDNKVNNKKLKKYNKSIPLQFEVKKEYSNSKTDYLLNDYFLLELPNNFIFKGCDENSKNNSREYRCKFYIDEGHTNYYLESNKNNPLYTTKFKAVSKYIFYSVDRYVSQYSN